jgi:hypothetical protein
MNSHTKRLVAAISRLLDPAESDFVCGDLEESHATGPAATAAILGLFFRRQLALWAHWEPWIALIGISILAASYLGEFWAHFGTGLFLQLQTYFKYGVHYGSGVTPAQDVCHLLILGLALATWSWASGFALAALSRGTLWLTACLFYVAVQEIYFIRLVWSGNLILAHPLWLAMLGRLLPLSPAPLAFVTAAVCGAYRGKSKVSLTSNQAIGFVILAATLTLLLLWSQEWYETALQAWSEGAIPPTPLLPRILPVLVAAWPAMLIPFLNRYAKYGEAL